MERLELIEQLKTAGIRISDTTWRDRHSEQAFIQYPIIYCPTNTIRAKNMVEPSFNELSMGGFLEKAGLKPRLSYYGNILKHHFI